jgi:hypothetical protein
MKKIFKYIFLFVLFPLWGLGGFGWASYAQLYPVQLTPVFNSPYSLKLSDYATSMDTKMQLLINPTDISINKRQVRLKFSIQGNGINAKSTDFIQGENPIFINGGELQTLTNVDIAALFRLENLQGISAVQYANPLPEGMYDFCFEMYDFATNQKISQKSCSMLYLILNDPPLLNTPQRNEQIAATDFPNILFTWTPRQINATNVSYTYELKELLDPSIDPQYGFQMAPLLYQETDLRSTAMVYDLGKPNLIPGKRYAWRVRAVSTSGLSENSVFKNDGYSEVFSFKYTPSCNAPTFLLSESQSTKSVKITWQGVPEHTRYQLQYKKQDVRNAQWFSTNSLNTQSLITNLEPGVTYEFRVGSSCDAATEGVQSFTYSGISTFTTPTETNGVKAYNCGIIPKISIQNQKPIDNLIVSETFTAGDFPVTILELDEQRNPYSGRGYIIVPYLADTKIAVEFKNIVVNTDYQLISGVVETSYNPDWKNITDLEDFTGEGAGGQIEETVPFVIKDIVINANGDIVVNGVDGQQITIPGGKDTVITDSGVKDANGKVIVPPKVYTVDSDGNGSSEGVAAAEGGKSTPENTDGVDKSGQTTAFTAKGISIAFSGNGGKYAFDVMPKEAPKDVQKLYAKVGDVALPYKAVVNGDTDTLLATVNVTDTNIKLDSIVFKTQNGAKIDFKRNDKTFILTVKGNLTYAEEQILATIKQGGKWKVIGAFMLVHISPKEVNVALVPTDEVSEKKLDGIITKTQEIYSIVGVKINFKKEEILKDFKSVVSGNTIETEKNTLTSTYSTVQQNINALYRGIGDSYVLFVTNKPSSTGQDGYMRLNGQFGYVFPSLNEAVGIKTPAHELGHGIFKLEHPFEIYKTAEKSTDLLMDYNEGTVLNHQDWKQINDPAFKLYAFQIQASGELAGGYGLSSEFEFVKSSKSTVYTGSYIAEDGFTSGFVDVFKDKEVKYVWDTGLKKYVYKEGVKIVDEHATVKTVDNNPYIWLFANNKGSCDVDKYYIRTKYSFVKDNITKKNKVALKAYIDSILKDTSKKEGAKDNRDQVWGVLSCSGTESEQGTEPTQATTDINCSNINYVATIVSKHITQVTNAVNNSKKKTINIKSTVLSNKKYVLKIGDGKLPNEEILDNLEDKFRLLAEKTGKNVYFVPILHDTLTTSSHVNVYSKVAAEKLAKAAFENANLGENDALIVFPYSNNLKDTKCYPFGIAKKGNSVIEDQDISDLQGSWTKKILTVFSNISKPVFINSYFLSATGRLIHFTNKTNNVKGYSSINLLNFYESKGYDEVKRLNDELNDCRYVTKYPPFENLPCSEVWTKYQSFYDRINGISQKYANLEFEDKNFQNTKIWNKISSDDIGKFREVFIEDISLTNAIWVGSKEKWTWGAKFEIATNLSSKLDTQHFYNNLRVAVLDDVVYGAVDGLGVIPGLDNFTDAIGTIYAGVRKDKTNFITYSASFAIPFAGSIYLKAGTHEAKELWGIVAKKADNADGFVLEAKKIDEILSDEFHVSTISYGNEQELTEKIILEAKADVDKYVDKKLVNEVLDDLALKSTELFKKIDLLKNLTAAEKTSLQNLLKSDADLAKAFANAPEEMAGAWKSLKGPHPNLAKQADALEAFAKLKKNPSFDKMGLTDEIMASIQSYGTSTRKASYSEILNDLSKFGDFLHANPNTNLENFDKILNILKRTDDVGNNYKQGVHWMIRDLNTNGSLFAGKKIKFEHSIPNARPTTANSSIDLFCVNCNPPNLKVEYKSGPGSITSSTIKEQFIERDLFNANSLDDIQWRMEGTEMTKEKLVNWLFENRSHLENLDFEKYNQLFETNFNKFTPKSSLSEKVIEYFSNTTNYNKIFK